MLRRLDEELVERGLARTRSQAANLIKLGKVSSNKKPLSKPGLRIPADMPLDVAKGDQYVSRAGYKLESAAKKLKISFRDTTVLDVGSSTGGFTDYALQHGAKKVIAVDVGTDQLHPNLHGNKQIELHEKTDIRDFQTSDIPDVVVIDVSFISLREVLPSVAQLSGTNTDIIAMVKPQFEAGNSQKNRGVIKNDTVRRQILKDFEAWAKQQFVIIDKADSEVSGKKGNTERFYRLKKQ